jgi:hypothetical protein
MKDFEKILMWSVDFLRPPALRMSLDEETIISGEALKDRLNIPVKVRAPWDRKIYLEVLAYQFLDRSCQFVVRFDKECVMIVPPFSLPNLTLLDGKPTAGTISLKGEENIQIGPLILKIRRG